MGAPMAIGCPTVGRGRGSESASFSRSPVKSGMWQIKIKLLFFHKLFLTLDLWPVIYVDAAKIIANAYLKTIGRQARLSIRYQDKKSYLDVVGFYCL